MKRTAPDLAQRVRDELLPYVAHPAQYIGGEVNQLVRPGDWERAEVRVAVAFPDTYAIGMSHLGCQILYWLINHIPGACAERVYAPWLDAEAVMRARRLPLFTWDTRQAVVSADILAISLQYEMVFTTVLNMLDLAGIPIRAADRTNEHPLVIAGGPQADNPEPMAPFLDLVVVGDGEHSMSAMVDAYREYKRAGMPRREMILQMARRFPWVYAPNLYEAQYDPLGHYAGLCPLESGLPGRIERCQTPDFETCPFPERPLVGWTPVVHDRIAIEIMRGCPQVCRFCHAGYTKRPLKYRSVERVLEIADRAYWTTGIDEIGLLSLSTADYPLLPELAAAINERFAPRMVNLSFPSLRVDKMLQHIPWMAKSVRKGGITMAIEAARDDMRRAIRKKVTDGKLLDGVREVYKAGWNRVKLYFMAGFPGERDDDIYAIWELSNAVSLERQAIGKPPAEVTASVGWLVPKPFTPMQWMAQPPLEYFKEVHRKLRQLANERGAHFPGPTAREGAIGGPTAREGAIGGPTAREGAIGGPTAREGAIGGPTAREGAIPGPTAREGEIRAPATRDGMNPLPPAHQHALPGGRASVPGGIAGGDEEDFRRRFFDPRNSRGQWGGRRSRVRIQMHDPQRSILEGVFARGDRRLAPVIEDAWRRGARFDGWDESFNYDHWLRAFERTGIDPAYYAHRERAIGERLPWDHIGLHMPQRFLERGYHDIFTQIGVPLPTVEG